MTTRKTNNLLIIAFLFLPVFDTTAESKSNAQEITKITLDEQGRTTVNDAAVSHYPNLKAVFLSMPTPVYALELRRRNITGNGIFSVSVDEKGKVTDVTVRKSTGHRELDAQATYGLRQWRAKPGLHRRI